jgi:hypothetical protein
MSSPYPPRYDASAPAVPAVPFANPMLVPNEMVPPIRGVTAFLSSQTRGGDWILPRLFRAVSFWGSVDIDLTNARLGAGASHIELMVIMGSVTIIVPPDIRVECDGDPFIGSFDMHGERNSAPPADAPTIRVTGSAILGSVEVRIVDPNASSWIEKVRTRWAAVRGG